MDYIKRGTAWFTAQRREAIYVAVAAIVPVLVLTRVIEPGQSEFVLTLVTVVLQVAAALLALLNLTPAQAGDWFVTRGRAAIYGLAVLAAPAAVGLGWLSDTSASDVLTIVSVGLTVLGAIIGVIFIKPDINVPVPS